MMIRNGNALQTISLTLALCLGLAACGGKKNDGTSITYNMGDRVDVKGVVYNVLEADWQPSIGDGGDQKIPKHRFLVIRLAITNGTGAQVSVPFLSLEGGKGDPVMEVDEVKSLPGWLGIVRLVNPAQTEEGRIVFDVPPASYKLRVVAGVGDEEDSRLIDIPYAINDVTAPAPLKK